MKEPQTLTQEALKKWCLEELASELKAHYKRSGEGFCLWLKGDLGAGKTTLARYLLHGLGLPRDTPVPSPTYTTALLYSLPWGEVVHLDLYRMEQVGELWDLGFDESNVVGYIIEWPQRMRDSPALPFTHLITLEFLTETTRKLTLKLA